MTNDEYIDKQQALSQILDILNVIAVKKANGEKIRRQSRRTNGWNSSITIRPLATSWWTRNTLLK